MQKTMCNKEECDGPTPFFSWSRGLNPWVSSPSAQAWTLDVMKTMQPSNQRFHTRKHRDEPATIYIRTAVGS